MNAFTRLVILAQEGAAPTGPNGPPGTPPNPVAAFLPLALAGAFIVFLLLSTRSNKKREERKRNEMYESMRKNDRVLTIGGVVGTIISVKEDEVILKVDESTNTKMTFLKSAIQRVMIDEAASL